MPKEPGRDEGSFGALLRRHRLERGRTQEELGARAGLSARAISDLERGLRRTPQRQTVGLLAQALALSPAEATALAATIRRARPRDGPTVPEQARETREAAAPTGGTGLAVADSNGTGGPLRGASRRGPLTGELTNFVGREGEVATILAQLRRTEVRLLTLIGPGGVGKTRLALRAAEALAAAGAYEHGVHVVPLGPLRDPEQVLPALAQTLGVRQGGGRPLLEALIDRLQDEAALLVLDNFEHVLPAGPQVAALLARCPHLKALVTSRSVLRLSGEHDLAVPPLPPRLAVRLFVERAQAAQIGFEPGRADAPVVEAICRRLDGLPLAIELAAARVRVLPPAALLARLDGCPAASPAERVDRTGRGVLPLLTGGPRDLPARQQTLRDTIAWSYDLLTADERALFRCLGVFVGGCTIEAATAVYAAGNDVLSGFASLVDNSLVLRSEGEGGEPRFRMLQTVHEFALERLESTGELVGANERHAGYFLGLAEGIQMHAAGGDQVLWLDRQERDYENTLAALAWYERVGQTEYALRLAAALGWFWFARRQTGEGYVRLRRALALPGAATRTSARAHALVSLVMVMHQAGPGALARLRGEEPPVLEEAVGIFRELGDRRGVMRALCQAGLNDGRTTVVRAGQTLELEEELLALARQEGERAAEAWAWFVRALRLSATSPGEAGVLFQRTLAICRRLDNPWHAAITLERLGALARQSGDLAAARAYLEESLGIRRAMKNRSGAASAIQSLAPLLVELGEHDRAAALWDEVAEDCRRLGTLSAREAQVLRSLAAAYRAAGGDVSRRAVYEQSAEILGRLGMWPAAAAVRAAGAGGAGEAHTAMLIPDGAPCTEQRDST